jgi:hypothetical protein
MKTLQIISVSLTGVFLFSTLVCGLWMRYSGEVLTEGSKNFHMLSAILTTLLVVITLVLMWRG